MTLQEYKKQKMQNPDFSAAYDEIQPEMDIIRAIIDARISQNMTQKELSERTGINQTEISRLEMEVEIHPSNCFSALPKEWE